MKFFIIKKYNAHLYLHRGIKYSGFSCAFLNCNRIFNLYSKFKNHFQRTHTNKANETTEGESANILQNLACNVSCSVENCDYKEINFINFKKHMYTHLQYGKQMLCPLRQFCRSDTIFSNKQHLSTHFHRKHIYTDLFVEQANQIMLNDNVDSTPPPQNENVEDNFSEIEDVAENIEEEYTRALASLYLSLQAKYFLCDETLKSLINGLLDLEILNCKYLNSEGRLDSDTKTLFQKVHDIKTGELRSCYMRKKFYTKNFNYITPVPINLGMLDGQDSYFYYIPILDTLKSLLNDKNVYKKTKTNYAPDARIYEDISSGSATKNNIFFEKEINGLKIILYQDTFQIVNPLGPARNMYKIVGIYMTIANLPSWHRTKVEKIKLVGLCYEYQIKIFSFTKIFDCILKDLKILESDGIQLNSGEIIKGILIAVICDNLGAHQIGGFVQSFNTNVYFCRFCEINNFNNLDYVTKFRSPESYDCDVEIANATETLYHGVKSQSPLNYSSFHVCNPGLPPCIGHDLFEGVASSDVMLCLNKLVEYKIFSYEILNDKIKKLAVSNKEKYPKIKNQPKLPGSATENYYIINALPFALFDKIEILSEYEEWKLILVIRRVTALSMAFKISENQLADIRQLIDEYLTLRLKLFPSENLKPKHHFISHYPYLIRCFGPLRHVWTMRFESKHKFFRDAMRHSPNYKNPLKMLSHKHQLYDAINQTNENLYSDSIISDDAEPFTAENYSISIINDLENCTNINAILLKADNLIYRNIKYARDTIICCKRDEWGLYHLCKIKFFFIYSDLENFIIYGDRITVIYDSDSGLYRKETLNFTFNDNICLNFNNVLNVEPVMHSNFTIENINEIVYYFPSEPFLNTNP